MFSPISDVNSEDYLGYVRTMSGIEVSKNKKHFDVLVHTYSTATHI